MSFGKLYTYKGGPRSIGILAAAHTLGLDIEVVDTQNHPQRGVPKAYLELNPLGKTPTFVGEDGFVLIECIAIALHVTMQVKHSPLLGKDSREYVQIIRWMSFTNTDVVSRVAAWVRPLVGYTLYNAAAVCAAQKGTEVAIQVFEDHLSGSPRAGAFENGVSDHDNDDDDNDNELPSAALKQARPGARRYLVGEQLTLADLMCAGLLSFGFSKVFDRAWRERYPHFVRWYVGVTEDEAYRAVVPSSGMVEVGLKNEAPKGGVPPPVVSVAGQKDEGAGNMGGLATV